MQLALREIRRAKARFGLLAGAVGLLVFLILFQQALFNGLIGDFVGAVRNSDNPVLVFNEQARVNVEGSFLLPDQVAAVGRVEGVAESGPIGENTFTARTRAETDAIDTVLFGYELGGLGAPTTLIEGRLPTGDFEGVASAADVDAGLAVGDVVTIVGKERDVDIEIVGRADDIRWSVAPTVFVSYPTFEAAVRAVNPDATAVLASLVSVRPAPGVDAGELTDRIDAAVVGVEALTRSEAVDRNPGVSGVRQSFNVILFLAFIVVVIVVGFFFLILTVQKRDALTLLRAIGAPRRYLVVNLLGQIVLVLVAGSVVGVVATVAALEVASGQLSVTLDPVTVISTLGALTALSLVGGIGAVRRVLTIDPIDATAPGGTR
jgi:putative ABC transport system permease protein